MPKSGLHLRGEKTIILEPGSAKAPKSHLFRKEKSQVQVRQINVVRASKFRSTHVELARKVYTFSEGGTTSGVTASFLAWNLSAEWADIRVSSVTKDWPQKALDEVRSRL